MRAPLVAALGVGLLVISLGLQRSFSGRGHTGHGASAIERYTCPMHPSVNQAGPGSCPMCGMALVRVTLQPEGESIVTVDEASRERSGVRSVVAAVAPLKLAFSGNGRVTYDESSLVDVTVRAPGYVSKLFVASVGQRVERDQPLFMLQSRDGRAHEVAITAPRAGFAIYKDVVEGASLSAGARVYRIASIDKVWVEADVSDRDLVEVHVGQVAKVSLDYAPGHVYDARVVYVYPYLETSAHTGRVRLEVENGAAALRPGMYASVQFEVDAGERLQVPASAVVYTGERRLVFVSLGEGRYQPQQIRIGREANGMYEVTEGLASGQRVVAAGTFLLAAEARINSPAKYWEAGPHEAATEPAMEPAMEPHSP